MKKKIIKDTKSTTMRLFKAGIIKSGDIISFKDVLNRLVKATINEEGYIIYNENKYRNIRRWIIGSKSIGAENTIASTITINNTPLKIILAFHEALQ
jgi:signal peptidase I